MRMREFIKQHRKEIDKLIIEYLGEDGYKYRNDKERELLVLNTEYLYNYARTQGVPLQ